MLIPTSRERTATMEQVLIIGIIAPCSLVGLLILITGLRPAAGPALAMVLAAIAEPLRAIMSWTRGLGTKAEANVGSDHDGD
jgi:hypothetical protein